MALFGLAYYFTFGPNPPIRISKETTHLTSPLDAEGLPDYTGALLADLRKSAGPGPNGAAAFLEAMWPTDRQYYEDLYGEDGKLLCKELGLSHPPDLSKRFTRFDTQEYRLAALRFLRKKLPRKVAPGDLQESPDLNVFGDSISLTREEFFTAPEEEAARDDRVDTLIWNCYPVGRPWTKEDLPFLDKWIVENEAEFESLVSGIEAGRWYLPAPQWLHGGRLSITVDTDLPGIFRDAARTLYTKANHSHGNKDYPAAVRESVAILKLASRNSRRPLLIDQLVSIAIDGIGLSEIDAFTQDGDIPAEDLRVLLKEIDRLPPCTKMVEAWSTGERYYSLSFVIGYQSAAISDPLGQGAAPVAVLPMLAGLLSIDWNPVLVVINDYYDRLEAAYKLPTYQQQKQALDDLEGRMVAMANSVGFGPSSAARMLSPGSRGNFIADYFLGGLLGSSLQATFEAESRARTKRQLTRLGVALAIYRAEQGDYPGSLDQLVPSVLPELPVDLYHSKPFQYRKTDDGFLLYSLGENGVDDGGSRVDGFSEYVFEGKRLDTEFDWETEEVTAQDQAVYDLIEKIPAGADDWSLRVPLPLAPWPWKGIE